MGITMVKADIKAAKETRDINVGLQSADRNTHSQRGGADWTEIIGPQNHGATNFFLPSCVRVNVIPHVGAHGHLSNGE